MAMRNCLDFPRESCSEDSWSGPPVRIFISDSLVDAPRMVLTNEVKLRMTIRSKNTCNRWSHFNKNVTGINAKKLARQHNPF